MKKISRYVFFSFMLSFLFLFVGKIDVLASHEFWDIVQDFEVVEVDNGEKYDFEAPDEDYNYSFSYDYYIKTEQPIVSNNVRINEFYGVHNSLGVAYRNVKHFPDMYGDYFTAYKYNYTTYEFDVEICNPGKDKEGTCSLPDAGLYRLQTTGRGDGNSRDVYVLIQNELMEVSEPEYSVSEVGGVKKLNVNIEVRDPRGMNNCSVDIMYVIGATFLSPRCEVEQLAVDRYNVKFVGDIPPAMQWEINGDLRINFESGNMSQRLQFPHSLTYDASNPTYLNKYYISSKESENLLIKEYHTFNDEGKIANEVDIVFSVRDNRFKLYSDDGKSETDITSVKSVTLNDRSCTLGKSEWYNSQELEFVQVVTCSAIKDIDNGNLNFRITDYSDNVLEFLHKVSYDEVLLPEGVELETIIKVDEEDNNNVNILIDNTQEGYQDIIYACMFYGDLTGKAHCQNIISGKTVTIRPLYHYKGMITVSLMDKAGNTEYVTYEDVSFENGYVESKYRFSNLPGDLTTSLDVSTYVDKLIKMACNIKEECMNTVKVYAKYGNYVEEFIPVNEEKKYLLPTYNDILNKKFKDNLCAKEACPREVEVYVTYKIGNVDQKISSYHEFDDKLPSITSEISIRNSLSLEYKNFNIELPQTINALYANNVNVVLKDYSGVEYTGIIEPVFISYKDRNGNISVIDNQPYTYISNANGFGYYMLECRVKLLTKMEGETSVDISEQGLYGKSFFMEVELKDSVIPTLSLMGDSEVTIKQYDVYKDAGYKCEDKSECVVEIKYYLDSKDNPVEKLDTKVAGKYIIEYIAIDGDGNKSLPVYREVSVVGITDLDTTSIIVISCVVGVFVLCVVVGIISVSKKKKRIKAQEE